MSDYNNRREINAFRNVFIEEIKKDYEIMNSNVDDLLLHECCTNSMREKLSFIRNKLNLAFYKLKTLDDIYAIELSGDTDKEKLFPYGILDLDITELNNRKTEFDQIYNHLDNILMDYCEMIPKIREILLED